MDEERFLVLRMGALGDIIHTLPAVSALRESFPHAKIDWLVDRKWRPILEGNCCIDNLVTMNRNSWTDVVDGVRAIRKTKYTATIDFQSLYRSAILGWLSGAPRRFGFDAHYSRESGAVLFYTNTATPRREHKVEHNLELAEAVGARAKDVCFPLPNDAETAKDVREMLSAKGVTEYFVLSPGGGWGSKCWPPERYGEVHRVLAEKYGWRGVISFGPGEGNLAEQVRTSAGSSHPVIEKFDLRQLIALLRGAKFLVAGDTGPLHLASALGTPVIGLYGPTDPSRNGPYSTKDVVVRKAKLSETTYRRSKSVSSAMLAICVEDVVEAVQRCLEKP